METSKEEKMDNNRIAKMREVTRQLLEACFLPDCPVEWAIPILSELSSVLGEVTSQLSWCDHILARVREGDLNELGALQGTATQLDTAVSRAAVLIKVFPDEFRKQLEW